MNNAIAQTVICSNEFKINPEETCRESKKIGAKGEVMTLRSKNSTPNKLLIDSSSKVLNENKNHLNIGILGKRAPLLNDKVAALDAQLNRKRDVKHHYKENNQTSSR